MHQGLGCWCKMNLLIHLMSRWWGVCTCVRCMYISYSKVLLAPRWYAPAIVCLPIFIIPSPNIKGQNRGTEEKLDYIIKGSCLHLTSWEGTWCWEEDGLIWNWKLLILMRLVNPNFGITECQLTRNQLDDGHRLDTRSWGHECVIQDIGFEIGIVNPLLQTLTCNLAS